MRFKGKTAVITGSGRRGGLGEGIALRLAKDGANIVISDIGAPRDAATGAEHIGSTDEMEAIAKDLRSMGVEASTCCLLYTSPSPRDQRGSRMPSSA